jgi:hypothetical protein
VGGCGWASASPHLDDPLAQTIRRDPAACRYAAEPFPSPSPSTCGAVASPLELARSARMQCLVGTTPAAHHGCWRSHIPRQQLREEELANQEAFSVTGHLPSEPIMRAKNLCLLFVISFPYFITRLLTARCASRGILPRYRAALPSNTPHQVASPPKTDPRDVYLIKKNRYYLRTTTLLAHTRRRRGYRQ